MKNTNGWLLGWNKTWDGRCRSLYFVISSPTRKNTLTLFSHTGDIIEDWGYRDETVIRDCTVWATGDCSE
jgi:hypothetical protein